MSTRQIIGKLLNVFADAQPQNSVSIVPKRFLQAFRDHGIDPIQIPRLFSQIDLTAVKSEDALLPNLTPELLDATAKLFGIRTEWLEGTDDRVYEYLAYYKEPRILLEHLAALVAGKEIHLTFPLRILTATKRLDRSDTRCGYMAPVLVEKIAELGERAIYRYRVYQDGVDWSHPPARIELKAIARIAAKQLGIAIPLHVVTDKVMEEVLEGRMIPRVFLDGCQITNPSLEDYVLTEGESRVAKEVDELPEVLRYIDEHGLGAIQFKPAGRESSTKERTDLPPLDFVPDKPRSSATAKAKAPPSPGWAIEARHIADDLDAKDKACGAHDSLRGMAERVAKIMRDRGINGPRGPLTDGTILREALQGKRWKRKR